MSRIGSLLSGARSGLADLQARRPAIRHLVAAIHHYGAIHGNQHAAAISYFAFLSFFPLVALGFAVLGFLGRSRPDLVAEMLDTVRNYLPGLVGDGPGQINLSSIASSAAGASLIGFVGLFYAGLGWVDALRTGLRDVWDTVTPRRNLVVRKLIDVAVLVVLGLSLLASVAISSVATSATRLVLDWLDLADGFVATGSVRVLAAVAALISDGVVLFVLFRRLPGRPVGWRTALRGSLLGVVLLETLKLVGTLLLGRVTTNPVYGTFAVVVGLMIWLSLVSRAVLLSAAWAVTGPGGPADVSESAAADASGPARGDGGPPGGPETAGPS
ncbi:MAG TPA: YihY/virulence factor BrkB family protein [Actinomycetes bacterium]|nr:YihY/virulence factor BrkB family protein [Actinomycetes bacterium]